MHPKLEKALQRWLAAGLLDSAAAGRIRAFESKEDSSSGLRWPVLLAISLGGLLVGAGVLLFVAAHWEELSPSERFTLVLMMVGVFHAGGAFAVERFSALASVLHAVGTITLGAGIFLAGQIFNLAEHWPGGVMMWAAGAWIGWWLLRDWPQAALAAILTPAWLAGEWEVATERMYGANEILAQGLFLLALVYLTAQVPGQENYTRRTLFFIGGLALIPCTIFLILSMEESWWHYGYGLPISTTYGILGYTLGLGLPVATGYWLRRREALVYPVAVLWLVAMGTLDPGKKFQLLNILLLCTLGGAGLTAWGTRDGRREIERLGLLGAFASVCGLLFWAHTEKSLWIYPLCLAMAVGMMAWGVRATNKDGINTGITTFAVIVGFFYFSTVMDKLGRSASLVGIGIVFLVGGWALERTRRRLIARMQTGGAS